ncbi:MAG TPA: hypothetical protein PJ987_09595 [Bacteroidia bacterium]|nr:hypothetical protein [Bacteroidia bacterium]HMY42167.1 hypothetical protein [Chitinophagales bacterium]
MARRILSWKTLNKKYGEISQQFRDTIESTVKKILKKEKGVSIRFKESVCIHFITDNVYADCRGIQLGDDGSLTFQVELHQDGSVDEYDDVLEDMDCASYYELLLALNEKSYVVEKEN